MNRMGGCAVVLLVGLVVASASAATSRIQRGNVGRAPQAAPPQAGAAAGYLGVDVRDVNDDEVSALKLKDSRGAKIIHVDHDGPAGKMGLRERDVVLQMNGIPVEGEEQIRRMLRETAPGRSVVLSISRDGQPLVVTGQTADRMEVERRAWEMHLTVASTMPAGPQAPPTGLPSEEMPAFAGSAAGESEPATKYSKSFLGTLLMTPSYTGLMLERIGIQLADFFGLHGSGGLLVRSVDNNSPAAMAGLKAGDVLVRANARTVVNLNDWARAIREAKGRPVTVVVLRDRQEKTLTLTPDAKKRSSLEMPSLPLELPALPLELSLDSLASGGFEL